MSRVRASYHPLYTDISRKEFEQAAFDYVLHRVYESVSPLELPSVHIQKAIMDYHK